MDRSKSDSPISVELPHASAEMLGVLSVSDIPSIGGQNLNPEPPMKRISDDERQECFSLAPAWLKKTVCKFSSLMADYRVANVLRNRARERIVHFVSNCLNPATEITKRDAIDDEYAIVCSVLNLTCCGLNLELFSEDLLNKGYLNLMERLCDCLFAEDCETILREIFGNVHCELERQFDLPTRSARMSRDEANFKARQLAAADPTFVNGTSRNWAKKIGCSDGLVVRLPFWQATMQQTGRGKDSLDRRAVGLTDGVLESHGAGGRDEVLKSLIRDQAADAEPSPLDPDPTDQPKRKVRANRRV